MVGMAFLQRGEQSSGYLDCETSPLSSHRSSAAIIRSFSQSLIIVFVVFFQSIQENSSEQVTCSVILLNLFHHPR